MTPVRTLVGLVLATLVASSASGQSTVTLQQAIAQGRVAATFAGTGGSSGDAVTVTVSRTAAAGALPLELSIPSGSILRNWNGSAQNMVVAGVRGRDLGSGRFSPGSRIVVPSAGAARYLLSAYCAEFEKDNPGSTDTFTLQGVDAALACITAGTSGLSVEAQQAAVWMYTDRLTFAKMNAKFPVSADDWRAAEATFRRCVGQ